MTRSAWVRLVALLALIAALAAAALLTPLHRVPDAAAGLGAAAPAAATVIGAFLLAALVPRTAISIACGALFGPLAGGTVALAAAMVASIVTFAIGRWLGRDAIVGYTGDRLARLDGLITRRGLLGVVLVRMMPIAPYGLVGYLYGTTSVRWRDYATGTVIGAVPSAFSYAAVGAAAIRPGAIRLVMFAPAIVGLIITLSVMAYQWRVRRGR